jgi:prevent-host-death family protein
MVKTLRESKAKLSELVERASQGEDVLITVRGKVKAKLTKVSEGSKRDKKAWLEQLKDLQRQQSTGQTTMTTEDILNELREERF